MHCNVNHRNCHIWKHQLWSLGSFSSAEDELYGILLLYFTKNLNSSEAKYCTDAFSWKRWCKSNMHLFLSKQMVLSGKSKRTTELQIQSLYHYSCWLAFNDFSVWSCSFSLPLFSVSSLINIEYLMVIWGWTVYWNFLHNWIKLAHGLSIIWAWGTRWIHLVIKRPGTLAPDLIKSWWLSKQK